MSEAPVSEATVSEAAMLEAVAVLGCGKMGESLIKGWKFASTAVKIRAIGRRVQLDPKRSEYTDLAIAPVQAEDTESLALFTETAGGVAAVHKVRRQEKIKKQARMQAAE